MDAVAPSRSAGTRTAGTWLAVGALLNLVGFVLHPRGARSAEAMMALVAADPARWSLSLWLLTFSVLLLAGAGVLALAASERWRGRAAGTSGWALLAVFGVAASFGLIAQATVLPATALEGDLAAFGPWLSLTAASPFLQIPLFGGLALVAWEARRTRAPALPRWSSTIAVVAALLAIGGVVAGMAGLGPLGALFLAHLVAVAWAVAYGLALTRRAGGGAGAGVAG